MDEHYRVSLVLFDGFELLDVFGPVEILSRLPERVSVELIGPRIGPVKSSHGAQVLATTSYDQAAPPQIVLVPGGVGTWPLVKDQKFISWLGDWAKGASWVTSVCTGAALLATAGLLEGYRATSNKRSFTWVSGHGKNVTWVSHARWVHDRNRWTSAGVAAGMDMTVAFLHELVSREEVEEATASIEYEPFTDSSMDPFSRLVSRPWASKWAPEPVRMKETTVSMR